MQLVKDINTFFRKDKQYWINELFKVMYSFCIEQNNCFMLTSTYKTKWLNRNNHRKIMWLLKKYKFVKSWKVYNSKYKKKCTYYSLSTKLYNICRKISTKLVNKYNFIQLHNDININDVKIFIKNIYKKTEFIIDTNTKITKHIFRLKWIIYKLFRDNQWIKISQNIWFNKIRIYNFIEFNNLVMKWYEKQ